jgi:hypothetical protein
LPPEPRTPYDRNVRVLLPWVVLGSLAATSAAGTLIGKLELPSQLPERQAQQTKGFLERVENPLAPVSGVDVKPQMFVVLEGGDTPVSPPQVNWELVGDSFSRPVVAAPAGAEVVIKNISKTPRTLAAKEDPKLIQGPINPTGPKTFRPTEAGKVYHFVDADAPHLRGTLVVVGTQYIGYPDESGKFQIADVPAGSYKLKIWYAEGWLPGIEDPVTIKAKGATDYNPKVPAGAFAPAPKK